MVQQPVFRLLDNAAIGAWLKACVEIARTGNDGYGLNIGHGNRYHTRSEFAQCIDSTLDVLDMLLSRDLLGDRQDGSIGLPLDMDMLPKQRRISRHAPQVPGQGNILYVVEGGLGDSQKTAENLESTEGRFSQKDESYLESEDRARAKTTLPKSLDSKELSSVALSPSARDDSQTTADSQKTPPPLSVDDLAALVMGWAKLDRPAHPSEVSQVLAWQKAGALDFVQWFVRRKISQGKTIKNLGYVEEAVNEHIAKGGSFNPPGSASPAPAPPVVPLNDVEQTFTARVKPSLAAWGKDKNKPIPPDLDAARAAWAKPDDAEYVGQWLDAWDAWQGAGWLSDLKPPPFTQLKQERARFVESMAYLLEALTAPDSPQQAAGGS